MSVPDKNFCAKSNSTTPEAEKGFEKKPTQKLPKTAKNKQKQEKKTYLTVQIKQYFR